MFMMIEIGCEFNSCFFLIEIRSAFWIIFIYDGIPIVFILMFMSARISSVSGTSSSVTRYSCVWEHVHYLGKNFLRFGSCSFFCWISCVYLVMFICLLNFLRLRSLIYQKQNDHERSFLPFVLSCNSWTQVVVISLFSHVVSVVSQSFDVSRLLVSLYLSVFIYPLDEESSNTPSLSLHLSPLWLCDGINTYRNTNIFICIYIINMIQLHVFLCATCPQSPITSVSIPACPNTQKSMCVKREKKQSSPRILSLSGNEQHATTPQSWKKDARRTHTRTRHRSLREQTQKGQWRQTLWKAEDIYWSVCVIMLIPTLWRTHPMWQGKSLCVRPWEVTCLSVALSFRVLFLRAFRVSEVFSDFPIFSIQSLRTSSSTYYW